MKRTYLLSLGCASVLAACNQIAGDDSVTLWIPDASSDSTVPSDSGPVPDGSGTIDSGVPDGSKPPADSGKDSPSGPVDSGRDTGTADTSSDGPAPTPDTGPISDDAGCTPTGTGVLAVVGCACPVENNLACAGNMSVQTLVCLSNVWSDNTSCPGGDFCDSTPGPGEGQCEVVQVACINANPGQSVCVTTNSQQIGTCGPDLAGPPTITQTCGVHQACDAGSGTPECACVADPVCKGATNYCSPDASAIVSCGVDDAGCSYAEVPVTACTNGACSGAPDAATCCESVCDAGATAPDCLGGTQHCNVHANGCTAWTSGNQCAIGLVCERVGSLTCGSANWAEWPIPVASDESFLLPSGDAGVGAPLAAVAETYTNNHDGTVTDNVTGLMWQQIAQKQTATQTVALAYCAGNTLGGRADWRLPTMIELVSLVDFGRPSYMLNPTLFPSEPAGSYWTSTSTSTDGGVSGFAYTVDFGGTGGGTSNSNAASVPYSVRCVR